MEGTLYEREAEVEAMSALAWVLYRQQEEEEEEEYAL